MDEPRDEQIKLPTYAFVDEPRDEQINLPKYAFQYDIFDEEIERMAQNEYYDNFDQLLVKEFLRFKEKEDKIFLELEEDPETGQYSGLSLILSGGIFW